MIADTLRLGPRPLQGAVTPPPSKSAAHRALICAALSDGVSEVGPVSASRDIEATAAALTALGARFAGPSGDGALKVDGRRTFGPHRAELPCGESGSTLRFLIPVAAAGGVNAVFTGEGRLPERPMTPYFELLPAHGCRCSAPACRSLPLTLSGRLTPGTFALRGDISSQFVTGLLLALPVLGGDSRIRLLTPLQSARYVDLTLDIVRDFGITITKEKDGFFVPGGQRYRPCRFTVERDWSQAAFWLAAGALSEPGARPGRAAAAKSGSVSCSGERRGVVCRGLRCPSAQGDSAAVPVLRAFGARLERRGGDWVSFPAPLHGSDVDASQIPDLVPVLAAVGAVSRGHTRIRNAARLRLKESDRLHAMACALNGLGAQIRELPDGLDIDGVKTLRGGEANGCNDHRVVMALAVAALRCREGLTLHGCRSVAKSYPDFFDDYCFLGGAADVVDMG